MFVDLLYVNEFWDDPNANAGKFDIATEESIIFREHDQGKFLFLNEGLIKQLMLSSFGQRDFSRVNNSSCLPPYHPTFA